MLTFEIDVGSGYCAMNDILSLEKQFAVRHFAVISNVRNERVRLVVFDWSITVMNSKPILCLRTLPRRFTYRVPTFQSTLSYFGALPSNRSDTATIVNDARCTNQYITPHSHHSNNTKQHAYFNTHQW